MEKVYQLRKVDTEMYQLISDSNKILLIDGVRQIGKSYIIRHVGKFLFPKYIESIWVLCMRMWSHRN